MTETNRPPMSGGEFDRDAATRQSERALDGAWADSGVRLLRLRQGAVAIRRAADGGARLRLESPSGSRDARHLFLGRLAGAPLFAVDTGDGEVDGDVDGGSTDGAETEWASPFDFAAELPTAEAEALAVALALTSWHASMGYSPRDGSSTESVLGGWARRDAHGGEHFPRTDPVVIVLVEHGDRLLLGSNALWESGRFSLLAGFVEAGESAEQAVVREVQEESGVPVENVRYVASQPWPFPRSFMLGFRASLVAGADPDALSPDPGEISELRWFTRAELRDPAPGIQLPRALSIARWLIDFWVAEGDAADGDQADAGGSRGV